MKTIRNPLLFILLLLASILACSSPWQSTDIIIGCSVQELKDAINDANDRFGFYDIWLDTGCDYLLTDVDNVTEFHGANGLPIITGDIRLKGNGATIHRSDSPLTPEFRMFYVEGDSQGSLELFDLTIENGSADSGGAVYNKGGEVSTSRTTFISNHASGDGGAIYNYHGWLHIADQTRFELNSAHRGGSVYNTTSGPGTLSIRDSFFLNNTASGSNSIGGAAYIIAGGEEYPITGSTFEGNQADALAGAIYLQYFSPLTSGYSISIQDSSIRDNVALECGGVMIFSMMGTSTVGIAARIEDSVFSNNQAATQGGGLCTDGSDLAEFTVSTTPFLDNQTQGSGGAVLHQGGTLTINQSSLSNNLAGEGGALYTSIDANLVLTNTAFQANQADTLGGAIRIRWGSLTIRDSQFNVNIAEDGGAIFHDGPHIDIMNSTFSGNQAQGEDSSCRGPRRGMGGALEIHNTGAAGGGRISDSTFNDNWADCYGGAISVEGWSQVTLLTSTIMDNSSSGSGGGLFFNSSSSGAIINSTFSRNVTNGGGGGIYAHGDLTIFHTTIAMNHSVDSGGGIYQFGGTVQIKNSLISGNTSQNDEVYSTGCYGPIEDIGENLAYNYDSGCFGFTVQDDPKLGPLADNGGPTMTHALLPGSPAIDAAADCDPIGDPLSGVGTAGADQRGVPRPYPSDGACDLGAYEFEPQQAALSISPSVTQVTATTTTTAELGLAPFVTALTPANCRYGPGTGYHAVASMNEDQTAPAIGTNAARTWTLVELSDTLVQCYVSNSAVEFSFDPIILEILPDPPTPTFTPPPHTLTPTLTPTPFIPTDTPTLTPEALGAIGGSVYEDKNNDQIFGGDEDGLSGVTVMLGSGPCTTSGLSPTSTAGDGSYLFSNLPAGTYCVSVNIPMVCSTISIPTTPTEFTVVLGAGQTLNFLFGYQNWVC